MGVTEVIGATPATSTSESCSTKASIAFSSPWRCSTSPSATAIRAKCAMRRTVSASTDMGRVPGKSLWTQGRYSRLAVCPATGGQGGGRPVSGFAQLPVRLAWSPMRQPLCDDDGVPILPPHGGMLPTIRRMPPSPAGTSADIGAVGLVVRDLDTVAAFYRDVIGLAVLDRADQERPPRRGRRPAAQRRCIHRPDAARTIRPPPNNSTRPSCTRRARISRGG